MRGSISAQKGECLFLAQVPELKRCEFFRLLPARRAYCARNQSSAQDPSSARVSTRAGRRRRDRAWTSLTSAAVKGSAANFSSRIFPHFSDRFWLCHQTPPAAEK